MLFLLSSLISLMCSGETFRFKTNSYDEARQNNTYFKFIGESTKLGFITTDFEGYVREGEITYEKAANLDEIKDVVLKFKVKDIDTNISARDEKLQNECLDHKKYPEMTIRILSITLNVLSQEVPAEMSVRGQKIPLRISIIKTDARVYQGKSSFKLSDTLIPDPSISVATIKDKFELEFQINQAQ